MTAAMSIGKNGRDYIYYIKMKACIQITVCVCVAACLHERMVDDVNNGKGRRVHARSHMHDHTKDVNADVTLSPPPACTLLVLVFVCAHINIWSICHNSYLYNIHISNMYSVPMPPPALTKVAEMLAHVDIRTVQYKVFTYVYTMYLYTKWCMLCFDVNE